LLLVFFFTIPTFGFIGAKRVNSQLIAHREKAGGIRRSSPVKSAIPPKERRVKIPADKYAPEKQNTKKVSQGEPQWNKFVFEPLLRNFTGRA
jgi:hypothetical protein